MFPTFYTKPQTMFYVSAEPETPGDRLKKIRVGLKFSARKAEKLSDPRVSHSNIGKIESGITPWENVQRNTIKGLARAYGRTPEELLNEVNGTPYPKKPNIYTDEVHLETSNIYNQERRRIPVYDLVSAGPGSDGGVVVAYVDIGPEFVGDHSAYRVAGISMRPEIEDGDVIIVKLQDYAAVRNDIVCWTASAGMLCKRLSSNEDGLYVLTSINPEYQAIVTKDVHIYGIVVEVRKRRKIYNGTH